MSASEDPEWEVPGWDWHPNDSSWLDAGARLDGVSVFFIHGGRIRHQAHITCGRYTVDEFVALLRKHAEGLDNPVVRWSEDTGGGEAGLWVEGTRAPGREDLARLKAARRRQLQNDEMEAKALRRRHPEWFTTAAPESL